eukprot:CAMPEP_0168419794 /NCGR_PEP_ID=MMETSP0228-20121227/32448_1 /TAXON_ID=133427 /ORGANISM="Protoceratium reticulatum, Strain CCCM 535 (=CCMP 1889)" /LENGTH=82 /DNA_ID=CAMNT_0008433679 /DNA_START=232 /DNA_END=476 /DNA_ORIENTATION=-
MYLNSLHDILPGTRNLVRSMSGRPERGARLQTTGTRPGCRARRPSAVGAPGRPAPAAAGPAAGPAVGPSGSAADPAAGSIGP